MTEHSSQNSSHAVWVAVGLALALVSWPVSGAAQDEKDGKKSGGQSSKTIELDQTVIEGRMEKPEAFYILQHSEPNYEVFEAEPSFLPELLQTVQKDPF